MKRLARATLFGTTILWPALVLAQAPAPAPADPAQGSSSQATKPSDLTVAPTRPQTDADRQEQARPTTAQRGPANICQELVAFLQPKPPAPAPAAGGPGAAPAPAPGGAAPAAQAAPAQAAPAQAAAAPAAGQGSPPPAPGQTSPTGQGTTPQATSGVSAPVPQAQTAAKPSPVSLEEAQALAGSNNLRGCQEAAQKMRRAGVSLPAGLIALAALKPELLQAGQP